MSAHSKDAFSHTRLWIFFGVSLFVAFFILGFFGRDVYRQAPPLPDRVITASGTVLATEDDILTGQQVWQSTGGQQLGSIWGHGAYQAPDWSADWLHREATNLLDVWAEAEGAANFAALDAEAADRLRARLVREMRTNTLDAGSGTLRISDARAAAIARTAAHFDGLFGGAPEQAALREAYAMSSVTVPDTDRRRALTAFFFWTSWASTTERPGQTVTYTNNWPHEELVD
ncbi:MAG: nitric-oxide reductase large subunit, partial [Acidobacteria bacterium]|nr:nitric-oxide reductase large subunit [Acidobacteriota bacterium]